MTESFSHWMFRGTAALFAVFFAASLWPKNLKVAPTSDDLADRRFEMRVEANCARNPGAPYNLLAMANSAASPSMAKEDRRVSFDHPPMRFHLPTPASLPH
jgi:hypothetical protein